MQEPNKVKRRQRINSRPFKFHQAPSNIEQEVRIEIVPLIDVIFCILTFFILGAVGLSRQQAIGLDLPKAQTGTPQMREMLVVSLDEFGQVYLEQQAVTREQLSQSIQRYHELNPDGLMVLHASRNASYNEVINVLDSLRQIGGDRVALATLPGQPSPQDSWLPSPNNPALPPNNTYPGIPGTTLPQPSLGTPINPIPPNSQQIPRLNGANAPKNSPKSVGVPAPPKASPLNPSR